MKSLLEMLENNNRIPMHMPGHKRNVLLSPYLKHLSCDLDITEIDGFDDLHNPEGVLKESMKKAAALRGSKKAFYLVNGSTCGILAAICGVIKQGDTVICARNCHKSVYNALELSDANVVFVNPPIEEKTGICGSINPLDIEKKLDENPDTKLVVLTSPTYEGVVSNVEAICDISHKKNIPVLVDAAHGAHFGFGHGFPKSATECGADIAVESLHKTLPSLTQTAVCHISGDLVDIDAVAEKLSVFQTSSPSYLLMASIDGCIDLISEKGDKLFECWANTLEKFYKKAEKLKNIGILKNDGEFFGLDKSKIVMCAKDGKKLAELLRENGIECEMAMPGYALAMTGMGDTDETLSRLADALIRIDGIIETGEIHIPEIGLLENEMSLKDAKKAQAEYVSYIHSVGRVCAEYIWAYPPGVPIIIPGEKISQDAADALRKYEEHGFKLKGNTKRKAGEILVIK